jgi:hypothetical protein
MSMKNSNDTIGNRSRDLPVCSAVYIPEYNTKMKQINVDLFRIILTNDVTLRKWLVVD